MIVETVRHGDCTWNYDDEFCRDTTPEQTDRIIQHVSQIIMNAMLRKREAESRGEE